MLFKKSIFVAIEILEGVRDLYLICDLTVIQILPQADARIQGRHGFGEDGSNVLRNFSTLKIPVLVEIAGLKGFLRKLAKYPLGIALTLPAFSEAEERGEREGDEH